MKANPGALVLPENVVGRDELIAELWDRLEQQSVVLSAERRMGKTSVTQKMEAECADKITLYRDLEAVKSQLEFANLVLQDVEQYLHRVNRTAKRARKFVESLGGAEIKGWGIEIKLPQIAAAHWKQLLTNTFEDLIEHQGTTVQVVLFWDEVPWMLQAIARNQGAAEATEVFDTLRAIRQTFPNVRMVFTGSIGLHHVTDQFRDAGYTNPATNDMYVFDLPPLDPDHAQSLAVELLKGEGIALKPGESLEDVGRAIATAVENIPYYIQHLVVELKRLRQPVDVAWVEKIVEQALTDSQDRWQLQHYQNRLKPYYGEGDRYRYALDLLDILAFASEPMPFRDLVNAMQIALRKTCDQELLRTVLGLLKKDYYLVQEGMGYRFRYQLIQRYWQLARG